MSLWIDFQSEEFPPSYGLPKNGYLRTSWDDLLWAAITIGRPSAYHVFRHGPSSFHEAVFRLSLIRMAVEQGAGDRLHRTNAFRGLDPTEKGMVSYFLGMTLCKLFAAERLATPWLLHLDVFRATLRATNLGRSRPDLVGEDTGGRWHGFESKGRSSAPSSSDKAKAKDQAVRLISVGGTRCSLHVGSFAFFTSDDLQFYWRDPEPSGEEQIKLPRPTDEWRFYYQPALAFASEEDDAGRVADRALADVQIEIHPKIKGLLIERLWLRAKEAATELREVFLEEGYQPDGLRVTAGESWARPLADRDG